VNFKVINDYAKTLVDHFMDNCDRWQKSCDQNTKIKPVGAEIEKDANTQSKKDTESKKDTQSKKDTHSSTYDDVENDTSSQAMHNHEVNTAVYAPCPIPHLKVVDTKSLVGLCSKAIAKCIKQEVYQMQDCISVYAVSFKMKLADLNKTSLARLKQYPVRRIILSEEFEDLDDEMKHYLLSFYISPSCDLPQLCYVTNFVREEGLAWNGIHSWIDESNAVHVFLWSLQSDLELESLRNICEQIMFKMDLVTLVSDFYWTLIPENVRNDIVNKRMKTDYSATNDDLDMGIDLDLLQDDFELSLDDLPDDSDCQEEHEYDSTDE
jgi:hypothetical protein